METGEPMLELLRSIAHASILCQVRSGDRLVGGGAGSEMSLPAYISFRLRFDPYPIAFKKIRWYICAILVKHPLSFFLG
jgi:hypothetical protein